MYEFFRWLAMITGWPVQLLFFKRKTYYQNKKIQSRWIRGGALIVSNHYHVFDFMVNMFLFPFRKLHVVYWPQENRSSRFIRWGMKFFGGIVSDRDRMSMRFMDDSVKLLEHGRIVQIYPEAHITLDGEMHNFKPSYVLIALRAGVPIIPVITDGNYGFLKRVHLIIGEPIDLWEICNTENPTREDIEEMNAYVYSKCAALRKELFKKKGQTK